MSYLLKYNNKSYTLNANGKSYILKVAQKFYEFTIKATPENSIVTINGEVTNSVTLAEGSNVEWLVSLDGYFTQSGSLVLNENITLDVELEAYKYYTLTINPTPSDATVTINGEVTNSVTVYEGTILNWEVSASGYITQSGTVTVTSDSTKNVTLVQAGPLYACFGGNGVIIQYAKCPIGSSTVVYQSESGSLAFANTSTDLVTVSDAKWTNLSENSGTVYYTTAGVSGSALSRNTAKDLYE